MKTVCVLCEVGTELLRMIYMNFRFQSRTMGLEVSCDFFLRSSKAGPCARRINVRTRTADVKCRQNSGVVVKCSLNSFWFGRWLRTEIWLYKYGRHAEWFGSISSEIALKWDTCTRLPHILTFVRKMSLLCSGSNLISRSRDWHFSFFYGNSWSMVRLSWLMVFVLFPESLRLNTGLAGSTCDVLNFVLESSVKKC